MLKVFISIVGLLTAAACVTTQSSAQPMTWVNDHLSELVIQSVGPDGKLVGTYSNSEPGYKCRGVAFPITGWMDGDRISYTVRWKNAAVDCESTTVWSGYFSGGWLITNWVVTYRDPATNQSISRTGSDRYRQK
jgi:hypothetical protein